jgi:uncharacterized protein YidB (DUF937 family)
MHKMAKGSSAMIAVLGALALAGYQNRDKLGAMLGSAMGTGAGSDPVHGPNGGSEAQEGGLLGSLREMASNLTGGQSEKALAGLGLGGAAAGGAAAGGDMMAGLSDMLAQFSGPDLKAKAESWVGTGPNHPLAPEEVEQALNADTISALLEKTGLNRSDLLSRLSAILPEAVDKMTPDGKLPDWLAQGARSA